MPYRMILIVIMVAGILLFSIFAYIGGITLSQAPHNYSLPIRLLFVFFGSGGLILCLSIFSCFYVHSSKAALEAILLIALLLFIHYLLLGFFGHAENEIPAYTLAFIIELAAIFFSGYFLKRKKTS